MSDRTEPPRHEYSPHVLVLDVIKVLADHGVACRHASMNTAINAAVDLLMALGVTPVNLPSK